MLNKILAVLCGLFFTFSASSQTINSIAVSPQHSCLTIARKELKENYPFTKVQFATLGSSIKLIRLHNFAKRSSASEQTLKNLIAEISNATRQYLDVRCSKSDKVLESVKERLLFVYTKFSRFLNEHKDQVSTEFNALIKCRAAHIKKYTDFYANIKNESAFMWSKASKQELTIGFKKHKNIEKFVQLECDKQYHGEPFDFTDADKAINDIIGYTTFLLDKYK